MKLKHIQNFTSKYLNIIKSVLITRTKIKNVLKIVTISLEFKKHFRKISAN